MKDEPYWPVLSTWLKDTADAPPDARQTAHRVAERLPQTPQLRRHWWLPSRPRIRGGPADSDTTDRPTPIPATSGHTPTIIGRTHSMLSPVNAISAGALVFAIGGLMVLAQPFVQQGGVPGAATNDPAMAPSFFRGTTNEWHITVQPATVRRDDGVVEGTGETYEFSWEADDPRIAGAATLVMNETDYREGATGIAPGGNIGTIRTLLLDIVNDEGSWEGPFTLLQIENPEIAYISGWLTGMDAYEGLSAYVVWSLIEAEDDPSFWGHITAEGPPPMPERPAQG